MKRFLACFWILAALGGSPALAEKVVLGPSSDWKVREYDDKCRLSRNFGAGEDGVTLWLDRGGMGPSVNLTLIGNPVRNPFGPRVEIGFSPQQSVERNYISLKSSKGRPVLSMFGVNLIGELEPDAQSAPVDDVRENEDEETVDLGNGRISGSYVPSDYPERLAQIRSLDLSGAALKPLSLEFDNLDEGVEELAECSRALLIRIKENAVKAKSQGAAGPGATATPKDMEQWVTKIQNGYPQQLLKEREEGTVGVRLTVNTKGRATFCEVVQFSGPASFNDTACLLLLRHSRFNPATDANGNPMTSFYATTITYRLRK